jgi:hypothetical protein
MTIHINDSIHIPSLSSSISVGNGAPGTFNGTIYNNPHSYIDQNNSVTGSTNTNTVSDDPHHVKASIEANTHAWQSNTATVDQQAYTMAGLGGNGGNDNMVLDSGNVTVDPTNHVHLDFSLPPIEVV